MRRQLPSHLRVRRQIKRGLAVVVFQPGIGAALQESFDHCGVAGRGGDHQRGAAAVVGGVERGAVRHEEIDDAADQLPRRRLRHVPPPTSAR